MDWFFDPPRCTDHHLHRLPQERLTARRPHKVHLTIHDFPPEHTKMSSITLPTCSLDTELFSTMSIIIPRMPSPEMKKGGGLSPARLSITNAHYPCGN